MCFSRYCVAISVTPGASVVIILSIFTWNFYYYYYYRPPNAISRVNDWQCHGYSCHGVNRWVIGCTTALQAYRPQNDDF